MFTPGFIFFKPKPTGLVIRLKLGNSGVISKQNTLNLVNWSGNRNNYIRIDDMNYRKLFAQRVNIIQPQLNTLNLFSLRKNISFDNRQTLLCFFNGTLYQLDYQSNRNLKTEKGLISYLNLSFSGIAFARSASKKGLFEQKTQQINLTSGYLSWYILREISYSLLGIYSPVTEIRYERQGKINNIRLSINLVAEIASQLIQVETNGVSQLFSPTKINKVKRINGIEESIYFDIHENITTHLSRITKIGTIPSLSINKIDGIINKIRLQSQYILQGISAQYSDFESKVKLLASLIGDSANYNISYVPNANIEMSVLRFLQNSHYHQFTTNFSSIASLSTTGVIQLISSRLTRANIEIPLNKAINICGETSTLYATTYDLISKKISQSNTIQPILQLATTINHGNNRQGFSHQSHCLMQHRGSVAKFISLPAMLLNNLTTQAYQVIAQSQIIIDKTFSQSSILSSQPSVTPLFLDLTQARIIYLSVATQIIQVRTIEKAIIISRVAGITNQVGKINNLLFELNSKIDIVWLSEKKLKPIKFILIERANSQINSLILVEITTWDGLTTQMWDNIEESIWNILS